MTVDLYYMPQSPPSRAVMLTAEAIGLPLNLIHVNVFKGEHLTPQYEQMNPMKTVPFIVDGDYKLAESHAIICYLVEQYAKDDTFYPKSLKERCMVDQRLFFDTGMLSKWMILYYIPVLLGKKDTYDPEAYDMLVKSFEFLDKFLEGNEYCIGRKMTIADFSLVATVTTAEVFGFDISPYKNVARWVEKVKNSAPGYKRINEGGLDILRKIVAEKKQQSGSE